MRLFRVTVLLSAIGLMSILSAQTPTTSDVLPFRATEATLGNGLKVIVVPTGFPNLVSIQIPVQAGSRNEVEPGKSGFAHFFEHLMFRGTPTNPPERYRQIMTKAGARDNASTGDDATHYYSTFAKEDLETIVGVYADMFQKIWVIFAVLLGIGGLTREAAHGTAGFTLSLPVSRRTLFQIRSILAVAELFALSVVALLLIIVLSKVMKLDYPIAHGLSHSGILFFGGLVFLAASLCISQFAEGEHTPALLGLGGVGLLYFVMQPYVDGLPVSGLAIPFSIPKLMAGPADVPSLRSVDWAGMTASLAAAAFFASIALYRTRRHDY